MFPILIFSVLSCASSFLKGIKVSNMNLLVADSDLDAESVSAKDNPLDSCWGCLESPVSGLGGCGCPPAIVFAVPGGIIASVNRHSLRSFTHISKEVVELVPPIANRHASAAVADVTSGRGVFATPDHIRPSVVCLCSGKAVRKVSCCRCFTDKAPAALAGSGAQIPALNKPLGSAGASAKPPVFFANLAGMRDRQPPSEFLSRYIEHLLRFVFSIAPATLDRSRQQVRAPDEFRDAAFAYALPYGNATNAISQPDGRQSSKDVAGNIGRGIHWFGLVDVIFNNTTQPSWRRFWMPRRWRIYPWVQKNEMV
jgi:hypothetical protein